MNRTIDFRYAPYKSWTAICRPDDPQKTLVDERGALLYEYERDTWRPGVFRFNRVIAFSLSTAQHPDRISQHTESARVPIVVTELVYPHAVLTLRTFARADNDLRADVVLWAIRPADGLNEVTSGLWIDAAASSRRFVLSTAAAGQRVYLIDESEALKRIREFNISSTDDYFRHEPAEAPAPAGSLAFVSTPHSLRIAAAFDFGPSSGLRTSPFILKAGEQVEGALLFPQRGELPPSVDYAWASSTLDETRRFWTGYAIQPLALTVPDPAVQDMLTACARNILQAREVKDGVPEFQVGATVYRGLWIIDGHFLLEAAQYLGHHDAAGKGIDALLRRRRPDGSIENLHRHSKETGIALATMMRQCELLNDLDRMRALWPIVRDAVAHIERLRAEAYALDPSVPEYGLMPQAFADGGIGGLRSEYTTPLWSLVGLKEAARMALALHEDDDAAHFNAVFEALLADLRRHAEGDMRQLDDGTPYLPQAKPGASSEHFWLAAYDGEAPPWYRINPWSAVWAFSQAIYPGEVFPPDDPLVVNLCRMFEQIEVQGVPKETGWLPYQGVWNYSAGFYAQVWLYAGRPDKAIDYLYAFANHATPTRVWREEQGWRATHLDQIIGDMPHNWASAEFIRLVRHLLVFERGDTLELLRGLPSEWLASGAPLIVERTPTRFGAVSLRVECGDDGVWHITMSREPGAAALRTATIYLNAFAGQRVTLNGQDTDGTTRTISL